MSQVEETPAPWYCPTCESWLGTKIETCFECGNDRPRFPLYNTDVPFSGAHRVTLSDRVRAKVRRVRGR